MEAIWFITGVFFGVLAGWLLTKLFLRNKDAGINERARLLEEDRDRKSKENEDLQKRTEALIEERATLREANVNLENQFLERQKLMEEQFENLANKIFDQKSKKFTDQNKENISQILNPLKEKIENFEKKVDKTSQESVKWNATLKQQIEDLATLNKQINKEAENLTKALKGESKTQGNWGEFILESILEKSGLVKNREYFVQESMVSDDGSRYQPDVVVRLPDNKHLIVDSKVALVAYERYVNEEDDDEKEVHLKLHIQAVRRHVKELSGKDYQKLEKSRGLDFVLLFIPVEPAFGLAVQYDNELFTDAYKKNIVVVSPTTLIATLRTIANIWKNEYQNQNAIEIARQSGNLYDKFVGLSKDLLKVGKAMDNAKGSYEDAMNKLTTGKGNLVTRVEGIKKLGASTSKAIDNRLLEKSDFDDYKKQNDNEDNAG